VRHESSCPVKGQDREQALSLRGEKGGMEMRELRYLGICLLTVLLVVCRAPVASCDVSPGDVIDKSNWQKLEGLVPDPLLNWVKKGDWIIGIEELNYDPHAYQPDFALDGIKTNAGKYALGADEGIVDSETGKPPEYIIGIPFPGVDPNDQGAAVKMMHNNHYMQYLSADLRFSFGLIWMGRRGYEREVGAVWMQAAMDGWPGVRDRKNPNRMEKYAIALVQKPFDVKGTAIMTWRYLAAEKYDDSFGYIPAVRRVRRMSPANRSDAFVGSDLCIDDANGYDGKVAAFEWKLLGQQEAIVPFYDPDPVRIVQDENGEWSTTSDVKELIWGYRKEGWQGAPWAPTNMTWVKRPVHIMEVKPKDPYYNYGTHYMWIDAETYACNYKVIHDRSGAYWKTFVKGDSGLIDKDKTFRLLTVAIQLIVDDRSEHSTVIEDFSPKNIFTYYAQTDLNDFSLSGFQRFCK
jgi:hypothetical protein